MAPVLLPDTRPDAELVEAVRITDPVRHLSSPSLTGDTVALWDPAQQALALVTAVPDSEPYRCLLPGRGIRAHGPTGVLFEVAFCSRCRSARMWGRRTCRRVIATSPSTGTAQPPSTCCDASGTACRPEAPDITSGRSGGRLPAEDASRGARADTPGP